MAQSEFSIIQQKIRHRDYVTIRVFVFGHTASWYIVGNSFGDAKKRLEHKFRRAIIKARKSLGTNKVPVYQKLNDYNYIAKI